MALVQRNIPDIPRTSDIEFFSSLHGREKRLERGIEKRDLQAAVKYGKKRKGHPDKMSGKTRWMYTLGNVVYITDETSTKEITSYRLPVKLPHAELTLDDLLDHERAKEDLRRNPDMCTSHTVIVVDHSRSMATTDVVDHHNRIKASFGMLALDFVANQVASRAACTTDVVSVMLMHDGVDVLFEREPMGRVLFNRLVDIHDKVRPRSHGNFLPSLDAAEELLRADADQPGTALCMLFLSDGRPSDNATGILRGSNTAISAAISDRMSLLAATFRQRLSVLTLGFASTEQDFSVLDSMAKAARGAGAKGEFHRPELSSAGLSSAIASAVSSLTDTKSKLSSTMMAAAGAGGARGSPQSLPALRELVKESADCEHGDGWKVYTEGVRRWEYAPESLYGMERRPWHLQDLVSPLADSIAIRKVPFAEGAERVVYKMQEFDSQRRELVGDLLVAKHSKRRSHDDNEASASAAATSLAEATKLASSFNAEIQRRLWPISDTLLAEDIGFVDRRPWRIEFLRCSIYRYTDDRGFERHILAEKWLEPRAYTKWNGNNGYVFHGRGQSSLQPPSTGTQAQRAASDAHADRLMEGIWLGANGDGDLAAGGGAAAAVDYGAGAEEYVLAGGGGGLGNRKRRREHVVMSRYRPRPTDYLQAFSHFSYIESERKMLVCDLQGVRSHSDPNDPDVAGVFELTDPVVHFQSKSGRRQVFGRTDLGRKGMREFFRTHVCNDVCCLLDLPGSRSPEVEAAAKIAKAAAKAAKGGARGQGVKRHKIYVP